MFFDLQIFATSKSTGSSKNGRDSNAKYRRVVLSDGQKAKSGSIILTQCGNKFYSGLNSKVSKNFTIFSLIDGVVKFRKNRFGKKFVDVVEK